jgi:ferric iron reductase protein FhuF
VSLGPYFAVERWDPVAPWRPLAELALDPVTLAERVEIAAAVLERTGPVPRRVVASVYSLGVVSRLVSPVFAAAVLDGDVPVLGLDTVGWQPVAGGPMPIAHRDGLEHRPASATAIVEGCLEPAVRPFLTTLGDRYRVSPQVLWGNAASAVGGAYAMLTADRPARAEPAGRLVTQLLARPPLAGFATWNGRALKRRNCCLFYRIPGAGTCGDCVLNRDP